MSDDILILDVIIARNNKLIKCKIEIPYLVAKKEMVFAILITDISFNPEKYKEASGYAKKVLNDIYLEDLTNKDCEQILNKYRGMGIMSGEICKHFDNIASLFVNHCISMCSISSDGKILNNTFIPKINQAMYKMIENKMLLNEVYQYKIENNNKIKIGKINLTTMKPEPI